MAKRRTNPQIEWLLGQLLEQGYRLDARGSASQLSYSSFDSAPGAGIKETDPTTGNIVGNFGTQFDGSHGAAVFTGPVPDQPSPPVFEVAPAVLTGGWDGVFCGVDGTPDETIPPKMDFTHVEVHASKVSGFAADTANTLIGTINTARGGYVTAAVGAGTWYLRLVARSAAGKRSTASAQVQAVVPSTVDVAPIEEALEDANTAIQSAADAAAAAIAQAADALGSADSAAAAALLASQTANTAKTTATNAATTAGTAQTTATNAATAASNAATAASNAAQTAGAAQTTASNAASAAGTAQTTATNAATAASNAATAAGEAQTTASSAVTAAGTAQTAATNAATAAANAAKKITVSTAVPSGTGNPGDLWYQKNGTAATAAIIGMWEWATAPTPAGWKVRTTDGGVISNMSIVNLIAGSGTMATGVIDKIFSDVVVAKTAVVSTAFIGTNAILTGAITAPKITASEELTAKVAQFLEVNAGMINTNSLWADAAWIAAARTHILTVLSNTNGQGYTSTVTGQGLRVTRTVGGQTNDVIRLGTFGEDLLAISDGTGKAVASISGIGDVGAQQFYSDGDVYANGRRLESSATDGPRGEVAYGQHTYPVGGFVTNATTGHTGAGVIDLMFTAERGRAYRLFGQIKTILRNSTMERMSVQAVWRLGDTGMVTVTTFDGKITPPGNGYETGDMTRTGWGQTDMFGGRFVPVPFGYVGVGQKFTCRVLIFIKRLIGAVGTQLEVETIEASIMDLGVPVGSLYGQNAGAGTTNMPAVSALDLLHPPNSVRVFRRTAGSTTANWALDTTITDRIMVGRFNGYDYISFLNIIDLNGTAANVLNLDIEELSLTMTPSLFGGSMGQVIFQVTGNGPSTATSYTNATLTTLLNSTGVGTEQRLGAWSVNTTRTVHFPPAARDVLRTLGRTLAFGAAIPQADRGNPDYQVQIPLANITGRFRGRRKAS